MLLLLNAILFCYHPKVASFKFFFDRYLQKILQVLLRFLLHTGFLLSKQLRWEKLDKIILFLLQAHFKFILTNMKNELPNPRGKHNLEFSLWITSIVWNIRELFSKVDKQVLHSLFQFNCPYSYWYRKGSSNAQYFKQVYHWKLIGIRWCAHLKTKAN